jgi:hypothetical protein
MLSEPIQPYRALYRAFQICRAFRLCRVLGPIAFSSQPHKRTAPQAPNSNTPSAIATSVDHYWSTSVQCHLKSILILLDYPISPKVLRLLNLPTQMLFFILLIILVFVCSLLPRHFLFPQTPRFDRLLKLPLKARRL